MKNQIIAFASLILLSVLNAGCKEDTIIKANVTPSSDFIDADNKIGDTLTIYSKTIFDDTIAIKYNTSNFDVFAGLGTLTDPYFGTTNWGIYMQVIPTESSINLPNTPDSSVLILPYAGFSWGDTTSSANRNEKFKVFMITDGSFSKDLVYYTKQGFSIDASTPIGEATVDIYNVKRDSVKIGGVNRMPHLRIKLTDAFNIKLRDAAKSSATNADFLTAIKGIYIQASDTNSTSFSTVPYFVLSGTADYQRASIAQYYNDPSTNNPAATNFFNFTVTDCAHNNFISRRFSSDLLARLNSTQVTDSVMFMQNEPGAAFDLRIPYIKNLPLGIINKAQLVITKVDYTPDNGMNKDKFSAPPRLYPVGIDAKGGTYTIQDRYPIDSDGPLAFMDGNQRTVTLPNGITVTQYYINIPREVQKAIVNKADELHLRINGTVTYPGAFRIIAGGSSSSTYKIRLNVVYSKIN